MFVCHAEELYAFVLSDRDGLRLHCYVSGWSANLSKRVRSLRNTFQEKRFCGIKFNVPGAAAVLFRKIRTGSDGYPVTEGFFRCLVFTLHG